MTCVSELYKPKERNPMIKVRIVNSMFGYERDQILEIAASNHKEALEIAQKKDIFAEVSVVEQ